MASARGGPRRWLVSHGDLARIDDDGHIHLLGRSHSVINVAGMKCSPDEIETVIAEVPGVAAVRVSGKANPRFGVVPIAEIEASDPAPTHRKLPSSPRIAARRSLAIRCRSNFASWPRSAHRERQNPAMKKRIQTVGIIGSGPSGATLASLLAMKGVDVTIFDDGRQPGLIVGESLIPSIVPVLRKLGIEERAAAVCQYRPGVSFTFGLDEEFHFCFQSSPAICRLRLNATPAFKWAHR